MFFTPTSLKRGCKIGSEVGTTLCIVSEVPSFALFEFVAYRLRNAFRGNDAKSGTCEGFNPDNASPADNAKGGTYTSLGIDRGLNLTQGGLLKPRAQHPVGLDHDLA